MVEQSFVSFVRQGRVCVLGKVNRPQNWANCQREFEVLVWGVSYKWTAMISPGIESVLALVFSFWFLIRKDRVGGGWGRAVSSGWPCGDREEIRLCPSLYEDELICGWELKYQHVLVVMVRHKWRRLSPSHWKSISALAPDYNYSPGRSSTEGIWKVGTANDIISTVCHWQGFLLIEESGAGE